MSGNEYIKMEKYRNFNMPKNSGKTFIRNCNYTLYTFRTAKKIPY